MSRTWLFIPIFALAAAASAAAQSPEQSILTYKQYASIVHNSPYVLEFKVGSGALLFYGAQHTGDPDDPQIADIQRRWAAFHPDVAYNEGGNPPTLSDLRDAVKKYAEPGLLRFLAGRDEVPVATFEPSFDDEIAHVLKTYSPQQVKVFYALRQVAESHVAAGTDPIDDRIGNWLSTYLPAHGLKGSPNNLAELASACKSLFPELADWHKVPEDWFDPTQSIHYTNQLANDSGMFRDQYIFRTLVARVRRGDRVFAVIGASHVVVQQPALIQEFGQPASKVNGLQ